MNENNNDELEPVKIEVIGLGSEERLRQTEVYYIEPDWLLCFEFQPINPAPGETLLLGVDLVIDVDADGHPYFLEFIEGKERWKVNDNFSIPQDCEKGLVKFVLPLNDEWYPDPKVICDKEMKNAYIQLSKEPVTRNIQIAENVIFSVDNNNHLHRIWLLNIETRAE